MDVDEAMPAIDAVLQQLANQGLALPRLGPLAALYRRLAYAFPGDPVGDVLVSSTGPSDVHQLPVSDPAVSAVLFVSGGDIIYRTTGAAPLATGDQTITQGSTVTLTGQASLTGFRFAGRVGAVTLFGAFYS